MEMYEGKVKFIIVYHKDDFDGICGFNAELFDIIDGSIPNRWNVVRIDDVLSIAPKNIERSDEIYEKLQELKLTFNNMEIVKPEYYITSIEKYKKDLLVSATENAEMRAREMLKVNKNEIGELENMTQGQFEILPDKEDSKHVNDEEPNQMYKKLRSVVTVTYLIKY